MGAAPSPCPRCGAPNRPGAVRCYLCETPLASTGGAPAGGDAGSPGGGTVPAGPPVAAAPPFPPAKAPPAAAQTPSAFAPAAPAGSGTAPPLPRSGRFLSFFEARRENERASFLLLAVLYLLLALLGAAMGRHVRSPASGVLLGTAVFAVLASVAWFQGAAVVLSLHGAREADPGEHRVLLNVVDEMRLAAGLPMPKVYVMETEGMNAFAAGRRPEEAAVAVTTGLLSRLDRDELQGVVAHELGHVGGRDTLYAILAAVLVGSVALLSDFFLRGAGWGLRGTSCRTSGKGGGGGAMLLGLVLALLAPVAAKLLQMSISRQREFRADAAAAAFTRNPLALASALEKISGTSATVPGANRGTQHLFIVNPLKEFTDASSNLFSTHPPTARRIERLRAMAGAGAPA